MKQYKIFQINKEGQLAIVLPKEIARKNFLKKGDTVTIGEGTTGEIVVQTSL